MNLSSLWPGRNGRATVKDLGFLLEEPEEEYRSKAAEYTDAEQLDDFRNDAFLFHKRRQGLLPERNTENGHFERAAAMRILCGGQRYEAEFAIGGPVDPRTGEPCSRFSTEFQKWAEEQDKPVLHHEQAELIEQLDYGVRSHPAARDLLGEGVAHGVVRCNYRDVPCQARLDWLNPHCGLMGLFVCRCLDSVDSTLRYSGPTHEMAFQRSLLAVVMGKLVPVYIVGVEKEPPHRCGIWQLSRRLLGRAQRENDSALTRLKRCRELDHWPTGYERIRTLAPIAF